MSMEDDAIDIMDATIEIIDSMPLDAIDSEVICNAIDDVIEVSQLTIAAVEDPDKKEEWTEICEVWKARGKAWE